MERKVSVLILGKAYQFKVNSPEDEDMIKKVAKDVSSKAEGLQRIHPEKTEAEIGKLIALNEGIKVMRLQKELDSIRMETESLRKALESYLEKIV